MWFRFFSSRLTGACLLLLASIGFAAAPAPLSYNRDIRPVLSENCFTCHGADSASRKAKLRLDSFDEAIAARKDGSAAIVPGKPAESSVVERIFAESDDDLMPPPESHKVLTPQQKDLLKRWIGEGAKYQPHWSFIAPVKAPLPKVKNAKWIRNPVDAFILAQIESERFKPAPEAERRTLARRLSYDLTGLPPKPEEVEAFVNDKSSDAYEKLVDRWLALPQWGEHRGRYWLDAARYADTHGIHFDNFREMWTYRDWVIAAFNSNMPFDQFTVENLAGDLLPDATLEQKVASGFNRCNITSNEGGLIDEEYLVLYARDRTDTTAQVWLGMTAGCAVCHDHKYDPLSQKEFYQLSAFFNNTTQKAKDGNIRDTPPVMVIPKPEDASRWAVMKGELADAANAVDARRKAARPEFDEWMRLGGAGFQPADGASSARNQRAQDARPDRLEARPTTNALVFHAPLSEGTGEVVTAMVAGERREVVVGTNTLWQGGAIAAKAWFVPKSATPRFEGVGDFERDQKFSFAAWVKPGDDKDGSFIARMTTDANGSRGWDLFLEGKKPAVHLVHRWPNDAIKIVSKRELPGDRWTHVCVTYDGSSKARGLKMFINGEVQAINTPNNSLTNSIRTDVAFSIGERSQGTRVEGAGIQDVRIYSRELDGVEVGRLASVPRLQWLATKSSSTRTKDETEELFGLWLNELDSTFINATTTQVKLKQEDEAIRKRGTVAHVMQERSEAAEAYLLFRGEYDQRRDKLAPATPKVFPPMPADLPLNRLGFAQWLVRPEQPLTARVTVNRFWQELFGTGLVLTSGDFGIAGEMPSHPELLDWLAVEFRESGWDVKKLFKLFVTSATYRQSGVTTPEKISRDPANRLLSHGPRFRMDAEMVRDTALAASGLLVPEIGGPSVKPYQPEGVWEPVAMPESDTKSYKRDSGANLYRRSLYTFWKRAAPPASMEIFNAPSRETCTVRRERTSTPLQALVTMNDPQFVEAARQLAGRAMEQGGAGEAERINFMARRLVARPLTAKENRIVAAGLKELLAHYKASPQEAEALVSVGESKPDAAVDKPTLAAYTMVANQLMNLDEVLNK